MVADLGPPARPSEDGRGRLPLQVGVLGADYTARSQQQSSAPLQEAQDLALVLRAGALPAPLEILEERTVGPSLGADSIQQGQVAGIIGVLLVIGIQMLPQAGLIIPLYVVLARYHQVNTLTGVIVTYMTFVLPFSVWTLLGFLLGIPKEFTQVALMPVAYTVGTDFKPAARPPVETVTYWDTWGDG